MKGFKWLVMGVVILSLAMVTLAGCGVPKSEYQALPADDNDLKANYEADNNELAGIESGDVITSLSKYKFRRYRLAPVLSPGAPGSWDDSRIDRLSLVRRMSTYYLYYAGVNTAGLIQIGLTTSTDLINWTKEPSNPILTLGAPGDFDALELGEMSVIYLPRTGEWKMWYRGHSGTKIQIGLATSTDGISWAKYAGNPVVSAGRAGEFGSFIVEDAAVIMYKGTYYMCYSAVQQKWETHKVGLATSPDGINWTKRGEILPYFYKPGRGTAGYIIINKLYNFGDYVLAYYESWSDISSDAPYTGGFLLTSDFIDWIDFTGNPALAVEIILFDHDEDIIYGLDYGGWAGYGGVPLYVLPRKSGSQIPIEMLTLATLAGGATSTFADSLEVSLDQIERLAITVEGTYDGAATAGIRVRVRTSKSNEATGAHTGANNQALLTDANAHFQVNELVGLTIVNQTDGSSAIITANTATAVTGILAGATAVTGILARGTDNDWDTGDEYYIMGADYDSEDWDSWTPTGFAPGATIRQTRVYDTDPRFVKVLIENLDPANTVTDIKVTAVLGAD